MGCLLTRQWEGSQRVTLPTATFLFTWLLLQEITAANLIPLQRTQVLEGQFNLHSELVHVLPQAHAACVIVVGFDAFLGSNPTRHIYNASPLHLIWLKSGMKFCVTKLYHFFRKILSSSSSTPTKPVIPSPARRVRITEPEPSSYHNDYISRLESLQQRLSGMESGECDSGIRSQGQK